MARKLTDNLLGGLSTLAHCTAPWRAVNKQNIAILKELERAGLAVLEPEGFVISEAGRAALASTEER